MNVATVLKVFKNSSLITEQGEYKISRVFDNAGAANKAGYVYHITSGGVEIYARGRHKRAVRFAVISG
jgi:hypothetical protein